MNHDEWPMRGKEFFARKLGLIGHGGQLAAHYASLYPINSDAPKQPKELKQANADKAFVKCC